MQMRSLMPVVGALALASTFCACGSTQDNVVLNAQTTARRDYDQAIADYENCLAVNPSNARACEHLRRIVEVYE